MLPAFVRTTSEFGSKIVSLGKFSSSLISYAVNLLMKTGVPFQTICITSPGGKSPMLNYFQKNQILHL